MNIDLTGKTALVCGSTQGIGKAIAMQMATAGAKIVLVARNAEKLQQTLAEIKQMNDLDLQSQRDVPVAQTRRSSGRGCVGFPCQHSGVCS